MRPGYKQTEVGVIPEDWNVVPMGRVSECLVGLTYSPFDVRDFGTLVLRSSNIQNGSLSFDDNVYVEMDVPARTITQEDDILICVRNGSRQLIGKCALIDAKTAGSAFGAFMSVLRSESAKFLFFQFQSDILKRQINDVMGATINQITNKNMAEFKVVWPPTKAEQQAIAEALSDADTLIESLEQLIAKKRQIKQGAMQELLTGKKRLPGFNGEWEVKRLGEVCDITMGRTPSRLNPTYWGAGYKWLSIADLKAKVVAESNEEITQSAAAEMLVIRKGTLLMSFKLSIGRLCFAGCDLYTNEAICSFNNLKANAEFMYYMLGRTDFSLYGKQAVKGYTLNKESLKLVEIFLPSQEEQTAIATILSDMDTELAALEVKLAKACQLKQGMMQELLTGRVRLVPPAVAA